MQGYFGVAPVDAVPAGTFRPLLPETLLSGAAQLVPSAVVQVSVRDLVPFSDLLGQRVTGLLSVAVPLVSGIPRSATTSLVVISHFRRFIPNG